MTQRPSLFLTAYFWIVIAYLLMPVLIIVPLSFGRQEFMHFPPRSFGLRWYFEYFSSTPWLEATFRSLRIALSSCLLSTFLGCLGSIALERGRMPWRGFLAGVFASPAIVPQIVFALALFIAAVALGMTGEELLLIVAHSVLGLPFTILIISSALRQIDPTLERAARIMGAGPIRGFFAATFPSLTPSIVSAAIFVFFISFDELIVALFVMGDKQTLPVRIWTDLRFELSPVIAPISTLMVAFTVVAMGVAEFLRRKAVQQKSQIGKS